MSSIKQRDRIIYGLAVIGVIVLGLASRKYAPALPEFIAAYAGDTLWALMAFLGTGMLFPRWPTPWVCVTALLFAFAIEVSQLYHSPWIDGIRHTQVGGLILGYDFVWSDLLCYGVGVAMGCALETLWARRQPALPPEHNLAK